ncbi:MULTISPECIES: imidazole glycerol phosphate synthase subunit HisH [unclassified Nitratiruptor]|uniref:imidazole glycerol phosphate synthase subunit HisH n=1 Tax=unclassified Nitratiruptor TaxID=2624044 RepID=UPI001915C637|nr:MULTISPECIES: imidazole glycerol phosphate synthase subunit HisH [unclassified Nitratiruptor]BCD60719.1 imidazole glycerol-phosphate synthase subunit HisH [Nitratiruptor sp. YY08-10]BCD64651.1 imidazole glycerol-phosphate synthase subunit HisH [Nitratiruptor sp. YY08-14]
MKIAIIDYNMGNLRSVSNAFEKIGYPAIIEKDPGKLQNYDKIILPGVGAFGDAVEHLEKSGLKEAICDFAQSGRPMLGICLGMQLLFEKSYEFGEHKGLGLIKGEVVPFDKNRFDHRLKVPHMGWNELFVQKETPLFAGLPKAFYLYFVHSYHAVCDEEYVIGKTLYGYEFVSAVQNGNVFGLQPHPEKSHENGLRILKNFVEL